MYNENRVYDEEGFIIKAGAIIVDSDKKVLLIYRKSENDWSFPKGHLEPNEDIETCLKREVLEETGLLIDVKKSLPDITYEYPEGDGKVRIKMFLCEPLSKEINAEFLGDKLKWCSLDEAAKRLSYVNNKELLEEVLSCLK